MNQFEKDFEAKFLVIRTKTNAFLRPLHAPMRIGGMRGTMPCWIQVGRALFDVAGWKEQTLFNEHGDKVKVAAYVAIELKENKDVKSTLRIVGDDGSGSGVQAHQLEALASVHRAGGISRILWNNGGIVAVLDGDEIAQAHFSYGVSVQAEKMRKGFAKGTRSIPWALFRRVDFEDHPEQIIIAPDKPITMAEEMRRKRIANGKLINAAEDAEVDPNTLMEDDDVKD